MFNTEAAKVIRSCCLTVLFAVILTGCAAIKGVFNTQPPIMLQYTHSENAVLKYRISDNFTQVFELGERTFSFDLNAMFLVSMKSLGKRTDLVKLQVTIDTTAISISLPNEEKMIDMKPVIGRSFEMSLSNRGVEADFTGAEAIQFTLDQNNVRNIETQFKTFFPNLPEGTVRVGDSWDAVDTVTEKNNGREITVITKSENKLKGFETVDGKLLARITRSTTGSITGSTMAGDEILHYQGKLQSAGTWYFAVGEGILVKDYSEGTADVKIIRGDSKKTPVPMRRKFVYKSELMG